MYIFFWNCHRALFLRWQDNKLMKKILLFLSMFCYLHLYQNEYILMPCCQALILQGVKIQTIFEIKVKLWNESLYFVCLVHNFYLGHLYHNPTYYCSSQSTQNTYKLFNVYEFLYLVRFTLLNYTKKIKFFM